MLPPLRCLLTGLILGLPTTCALAEERADEAAGSQLAELAGEPASLEGPATAPAYRFQVLFENDGSFLKPNELEDRHYTNGAALDFAFKAPKLADWLESRGVSTEGAAAGAFVAHEIYTPEDISLREPDPEDRPYAGYLYGGFYAQRENADTLDHLQLNLGVVGPSSLAEPVQEWIHDNFSGEDPNGWDAQLGDEISVNAVYRRTFRIDLERLMADALSGRGEDDLDGWVIDTSGPLGVELLPYGEVRVGTTHRDATVGGLFRVGWKLPDDFGPAQVRDPGSFTGAGPQRGWSVYAFGGAAVRFVEWNTFLNGSFERNPSPSVEPEPFIGLFRGGFAVAWRGERKSLELGYGQSFRTREFRGQEDANGIGQIQLTLSWGF